MNENKINKTWFIYIRDIQKGKVNISFFIFIARCIIYDTFWFLNFGNLWWPINPFQTNDLNWNVHSYCLIY